ncbi:MAG: OmpA family protein [Janthinobacterium lividum]
MVTLQNMPEELKSFISEHGLLKLPGLAGEHQADIQIALTRVSEVVMSGLAELAGQKSGRDAVWNNAREANEVNANASQAAATVAPPHGAGLIKSVLDDRYHGTVNAIVQANGLKSTSVSYLIDTVTGAALEIMGGLVVEHKWDAQQLSDWLRPRQFTAPVPVVMPQPTAAIAATAEVTETTSWFAKPANILLIAVSAIAAGEFGYIMNMWSGASADANTTAVSAPAAVAMPNPGADKGQYAAIPVANLPSVKAADATRGKSAVPVVLKLKDGVRQIIGANSTESKLYQFLIDPSKEVDVVDPTKGWIGFDRIYFETNRATLTNESLWQLSNVASILKRFPAAKIKLGGYSDSSGNPLVNLQLSKERAQAALTSLVGLGVPAERLTAVGYGALDNIATNDTEEGRALNRRVSMQVTQK